MKIRPLALDSRSPAFKAVLSLAGLLLAAAGLPAEPDGKRVIDPRGRFCFRVGSGWSADAYDANSDSTTIRHGATEVRLTHDERCWLMEDLSEAESREIETSLYGFGKRTSLTDLDGRYGPGRVAVYEGATSPVVGCVDVEAGWLILQGSVSPGDLESIQQIARGVRVDCARFDMPPPRPLPDPLVAGWRGKPVCERLHDDDRQRVLRCTFAPGTGHERHFHAPHFGYTLAGGRMRITGEQGVREVEMPTGSSFTSNGVAWHEVLNVGDTTSIFLIVEPR